MKKILLAAVILFLLKAMFYSPVFLLYRVKNQMGLDRAVLVFKNRYAVVSKEGDLYLTRIDEDEMTLIQKNLDMALFGEDAIDPDAYQEEADVNQTVYILTYRSIGLWFSKDNKPEKLVPVLNKLDNIIARQDNVKNVFKEEWIEWILIRLLENMKG